jgi:hypothetical protein
MAATADAVRPGDARRAGYGMLVAVAGKGLHERAMVSMGDD